MFPEIVVRNLIQKVSIYSVFSRSKTCVNHSLITKGPCWFPRSFLVQYSSILSGDGQDLIKSKREVEEIHPFHQFKRHHSRKVLTWPVDYLPIKWSYPPPKNVIAESGDLVMTLTPVDKDQPKLGYEHCDELKTATADVRKHFTLELASPKEIREVKKQEMIKLVQRHPLDFDSLEVKIAKKTFLVRSRKETYDKNPSDKKNKVVLVEAIQKRNRFLKILRQLDFRRFEFVCHQLQVIFHPFPLGKEQHVITRKGELRRLTKEYCQKLKQSKLDKFHEKLKAEREIFLKEKEKMLDWISREEQELQMTEEEKLGTKYKSILEN